MNRVMVSVLLATLLVLATAAVALAAKPSNTCPAAASGYAIVDRDGWWARTVAGFEAAGIDVYEEDGTTFTAEFDAFAAALGLTDGAGLEFFVRVTQWAVIDKNANGYVCMGNLPTTRGIPSYLFRGIDDQASTKKGDTSP